MRFPYKTSFWADEATPERTESLSGDTRADVAIVGGGFAGLSSAYHLKKEKPDLDVVLLEEEHVGYGPSGRNAGCVTSGMREMGGEEELKSNRIESMQLVTSYLLKAQVELEHRITEEGIDCEYRDELTLVQARDESEWQGLQRFSRVLEQYGMPHRLLDEEETRGAVGYAAKGGLVRESWRLLHPYRLARGMRESILRLGVRLHEGTRVAEVQPGRRVTLRSEVGGSVSAGKVVMATGVYSDRLPRLKGLIYPMHTYALATERLDDERLGRIGFKRYQAITDAGLAMYWSRLYDRRLLFGGGLPEGGMIPSTMDAAADQNEAEYERVQAEALRRFPFLEDVRLEAAWGGPIDLTKTVMPIIKELPEAPNVILNVGYNGEGITAANASGKMILGLVLGDRHANSEAERVRRIYLDEGQ
jgi:glycine/D-amino acid oxidase-like deaminating enzyme